MSAPAAGRGSKEYLGDSVYAEWNGEFIVLTTDNGQGATNRIYLDETVLNALTAYVQRLQGTAPGAADGEGSDL